MVKEIIVHTEKEFWEALKTIKGNTLIIFNDQQLMIPSKIISKKLNAREYANYYNNRLKKGGNS